MRWFRFYSAAMDDLKVQSLDAADFRFWVNLLCVASERDGDLPSIGEIAFRLRTGENEAVRRISTLESAGLLDRDKKGALSPHNWENRQYKGDKSTERVLRYRERLKKSAGTTTGYLRHKDFLFKRDDGMCVYCGSDKSLCIDHVVPVLLGGDDDPMNLAVACKICNSGKSGRTPDQAGMSVIGTAYGKIYPLNMERLHETAHSSVSRFHATPPEQNRTDTENTPKAPSQRGRIQSGWFSEFWDVYPLKKGKAAAERKYAAICKSADKHSEVMAGLRAQLPELRSREVRFIPHPTTWLNQGRWEDQQPVQQSMIDNGGYMDIRELNRRLAERGE